MQRGSVSVQHSTVPIQMSAVDIITTKLRQVGPHRQQKSGTGQQIIALAKICGSKKIKKQHQQLELHRIAESLKAIRTLQPTWVASVPGEHHAITVSVLTLHARRFGGSTVTLNFVDGPIAAACGIVYLHAKDIAPVTNR